MTGMSRYYLSRLLVSATLCGLLLLSGSSGWTAALAGAGVFALFLWAPHSGRYAVRPERGITALQHDEFTRAITDKAARIAFVVTTLALGGLVVYFGSVAPADVPVRLINFVLILGWAIYFVVSFWLRRT